ncbi:hypothetical protein KHA90_07000 [Flavobacterium psychroterrae]|uniref:Uncharacterized protein n=1 Tax=Flavobacterium psychroterrae TaxID=2133767 RepID=A0ABS5PAK4_9FLAO|nr:hypothetical protein [Flavobacterium psychroterrae]MBS7230766.1 hypothetical protein [Flavobacterium psychroterrae]
MKKITFIIVVTFLFSCKSDIQKKEQLELKNSDKVLNESISYLSTIAWPINTDSLLTIYNTLKNTDKIEFSKKINSISQNAKIEQERVDNRILEMNKELDQKKIKQTVQEEINWKKTKAGKLQIKHPIWSKEDCEKIVNNKIWIGMSIDMLQYMNGKPNSANPSNYGNGTEWQWCWDDISPSCFYGGDDGIITSYN